MTSTALYELAAEYRTAADKLADMDLDEQTLADTLESLSGDLETKATNTAMLIRNLEGSAAQIAEAEKAMAARRRSIENRAARIKKYVLDNMVFAGIQKIECPYFRIAVRDNPLSVVIDDERQIPELYMTDPPPPAPVPDKLLISRALKDGTNVPGCRLTRGKKLEIK